VQRVLVYGVTGSGKSTLARRVAGRLALPYVEVDELTWEPGWVAVPDEVQREKITAVCAGDRWVLDSAHGKWLDVPLARTDLVVGLDLPRRVSLSRLVRRTFGRILRRTPICNGNVETFREAFLARDSILRWHFQSFARKRARIRRWATDPDFPPLVVLRSAAEIERWVQTLGPYRLPSLTSMSARSCPSIDVQVTM
jgi:adenylate kinase family enzyme